MQVQGGQGRGVCVVGRRAVQDGSVEGHVVSDLGAAQPYGAVRGEPLGELERGGGGVVEGEGHTAWPGLFEPGALHDQRARQLRAHQADFPVCGEAVAAEDAAFHGQAAGRQGPSVGCDQVGAVEEECAADPGVGE